MPDATEPKAATEAPKKRTVKIGDSVKLVTAAGERIDATVDKVGKDGLIDLTASHRGSDVIVTSSPYDPTAKLADSWH